MLIKYPVSNPPSATQLETLPYEVYEEWLIRMGHGKDIIKHLVPRLVAKSLRETPDKDGVTSAFNKLQHLIYMLDEDDDICETQIPPK